ncbi:heptaprenylglyceryl phosphate synthase [Priestia taiwanensis]|uniref:Heptaprenylglyceryl phosphate synthase n=1 Tax=Priestia taiwanensis TaxID=1347902 RepID=A0A917ERE6_9BACI|nr:heptaprenylglyceryl phosphate synthase [Priestia taiwanensis]MBM7364820.1 putative glycerol-1-phosphate prenyltransferase [Priestia taiwanensis]GGE79944.1 heptaprenylglyceryl phosphate synthase [Priestia taiwanensis]
MYDYREWKHLFKLDPTIEIDEDMLESICESGTDAIFVSGTNELAIDDILMLLVRIRRYSVPCVLEVFNVENYTPGYDSYFIPSVLNTKDAKWITGVQHDVMMEYGHISMDEIIGEGYCMVNEAAPMAKIAHAECNIGEDDIVAYARMAEKFAKLPIFHVTKTDVDIIKQVKEELHDTKLFYTTAIQTIEEAREIASHVDTLVVEGTVYTDLKTALATVKAVKEGK